MKKTVESGYIWECPLCSRVGKQVFRCEYTARRHGVAHLVQMHRKHGLSPIIKESSSRKKQISDKKAMKTLKKSDIWIEIVEIPAFNVQPKDKLMFSGRVFVKENIFKKIKKQEAGR